MLNVINGMGKALTAAGIDPFKLNAEGIIKKVGKKPVFMINFPGRWMQDSIK